MSQNKRFTDLYAWFSVEGWLGKERQGVIWPIDQLSNGWQR